MTVSCEGTKSLLSRYLDGAVTGTEMQSVAAHLESCGGCNREFVLLRGTQAAVAALGRKKAPPELALKLKLALSREAARTPSRRWQGLQLQLQHAFNVFMVPATAGALTAIVFFGLLMGFFALPSPLQAANDVELPLTFYTSPELKPYPDFVRTTLAGKSSGTVTVEAVVGEDGRVQDYRVLSDSEGDDQQVDTELKNLMIFTQFAPATRFGMPTTGRAVLSFEKINVKG
jgi:TonB family protein